MLQIYFFFCLCKTFWNQKANCNKENLLENFQTWEKVSMCKMVAFFFFLNSFYCIRTVCKEIIACEDWFFFFNPAVTV